MNEWVRWMEDNYKYILMGFCKTESEQKTVVALAEICKKHNVSLKTVTDIFSELNEVINHD